MVGELCISFESRDMAISTFHVMGFQKGSNKEGSGNILETFFGASLTYKLTKTVVKPTIQFGSQSVTF